MLCDSVGPKAPWASRASDRCLRRGCAILALLVKTARVLLRLLGISIFGGVCLAACLAALIPGTRAFLEAQQYDGRITLDPLPQRSTIIAADGNVIGRIGVEDRTLTVLDEVPKILIDAIIETEDRTFYENPGVDVAGIGRALFENLSAGQVNQGGSTVTQQLVKNRILTPKRDLQRKAREFLLAYRLNNQFSKDQIMQEYLNTVYFGQGSYGITSAAHRFFGVEVKDLNLAQSALLAGAISSPEYYNPFLHPERARSRRAVVLGNLLKAERITKAQVDVANAAPLPTVKPSTELRPDNYFVDEVQRRLLDDERLGVTPQERFNKVLRGGLKVYTTYDTRSYFLAQAAVNKILPKNSDPFTAAVVSIDPSNGEVRSIVGGPGIDRSQYNLVTHQPGRQPGSTWKAITFAAAIEAGYSPNDLVDGSSPCTVSVPGLGTYANVRNAEGGGGTMTLRNAMVHSVNCAFVRLIASVGTAKVVDMAHRLGITTEVPPYLSITLGTAEATPLEMASVYATFASDGVYHKPVFVKKVVGPTGETIFNEEPSGVRAVEPQVARTVTDVLRGVVTGGTGTRARLAGGRVSAGKTGTTDEKSDAWFAGYTPQLSTVVWMGDPAGRTPMKNVGGIAVFGGTYPARIWKAYMDAVLAGAPKGEFFGPDPKLWPPARSVIPGKARGAIRELRAPDPPPAAPPPDPGLPGQVPADPTTPATTPATSPATTPATSPATSPLTTPVTTPAATP